MLIDASIEYQLKGIFDPDDLSDKLGIIPDSVEKIGDYQRRFTGIPNVKTHCHAEPFTMARWSCSVRKDIDILSFNALFDSVISRFKNYDETSNGNRNRSDDDGGFFKGDRIRKILITIHSFHSGYFYIDPKIIKKSLDICDEIILYYFCDFGHNEESMSNTPSEFYIATPLIEGKFGGIIDCDASLMIKNFEAAIGNRSLDEISCYYRIDSGGGMRLPFESLRFLSTVKEKIHIFMRCTSQEHDFSVV